MDLAVITSEDEVLGADSGVGGTAGYVGGLSGAVVYRQSAIGVIVEHHPRQGDASLQLSTFDGSSRPPTAFA